MAKDIDLGSKQWLDLVFEGRNKKYGAYELRESSSRRHLLAIGVVVIAGVALVFLPRLIHKADPASTSSLKQQSGLLFTQIEDPTVPEKMPARAVAVIATPTTAAVLRTDKFTPPVIVVDEKVRLEDLLKTQADLTNNGAAIGTTAHIGDPTVVGTHPDNIVPPPVPVEEPTVFVAPEVWPVFDGNLLKWLGNNIRYPVDAAEAGIQGRVVIRFVVGPDGSVGKVEILQSLYPSCDKEAVRVVNKMPKWIPGMQNNQAVAVYYTLPVHFRLQN